MWLLVFFRFFSFCLFRSLVVGGRGWQCWVFVGGGIRQVGGGWGYEFFSREKGREIDVRVGVGVIVGGGSVSWQQQLQVCGFVLVERVCFLRYRRVFNLCFFLFYFFVVIFFCRVSNRVVRVKCRVEQGQFGWDLGWEQGVLGWGWCWGVIVGYGFQDQYRGGIVSSSFFFSRNINFFSGVERCF